MIFGLSPYVAVHLLGHFDLVAVWVLPAFALALHRAVHGGSNRAAFAAGVVLVATAYTAYYYVVYLCLFTVAYLPPGRFTCRCRAAPPRRSRARRCDISS